MRPAADAERARLDDTFAALCRIASPFGHERECSERVQAELRGMRIEAEEDPLATAIREAREETGLTDFAFTWGHGFRETEPYASGKIARFYVAETRNERIELPVNPALGQPEHHEWRWVSFDEAHHLLAPRLRFIVDWAESVARRRVEHSC